jgi:hypothetical protein
MDFDDAVARLVHLLGTLEWPTRIVWVQPKQVLYFPLRSTIVFRPEPDTAAEACARHIFEHEYGSAAVISFYSPGHANGRSFAYVEAIDDLADGEEMFVADGLKVATQGSVTPTDVTKSRFWWWMYQRAYRKWRQRTERALTGDSRGRG